MKRSEGTPEWHFRRPRGQIAFPLMTSAGHLQRFLQYLPQCTTQVFERVSQIASMSSVQLSGGDRSVVS